MNAAIALHHRNRASEATTTAAATSSVAQQQGPLTFGACVLRVVPLTILGVFVATFVSMYAYLGNATDAAVLGGFLAFWLCIGTGTLGAGILLGTSRERYDAASH